MNHLRPAIVLILLFTALTGIAYPLALTGIAALIFPWQAGGEIIFRDGKVGRVGADRPEFRVRSLFPASPLGDQHARSQGCDQNHRRAL